MPEIVTNNGKTAPNKKKNSATVKGKEDTASSKSRRVETPEKFTSNEPKTANKTAIAKKKEPQNAAGKCNLKKGTNRGSTKITAATTSKVQKEPKQENIGSIALVSSSMNDTQLKTEYTTRNPIFTGLSGKNKSWLLSYLCEGSDVHSSNQWKVKKQADKKK